MLRFNVFSFRTSVTITYISFDANIKNQFAFKGSTDMLKK